MTLNFQLERMHVSLSVTNKSNYQGRKSRQLMEKANTGKLTRQN